MSNNRITWLDSCKGFAIILVVMGHIDPHAKFFPENKPVIDIINDIIYSIHMPLFFCISGYIFYFSYLKNHNGKRVRTQIMNNIYVYILWNCVLWAANKMFEFLEGKPSQVFTVHDLMVIPIRPIGVYWYLYVLIFMYIIMNFLYKINCNKKVLLAVLTVLSIIGSCVKTDLIFQLKNIMFYLVFFYIGMLLSENKDYKPKKKFYILTYLGTAIVISGSVYFNVIIRDIKILGVLSSAVVSLGFIELFKNVPIMCKSKIINLCGRYSLEIYVMHGLVAAVSNRILFKVGINNFYCFFAINFIIMTFTPILISHMLKKIKIHKLIFKPSIFLADIKVLTEQN